MCDHIPSDPTLSEFHEPIKCPHEQIFFSGILTASGECRNDRIEQPACWHDAPLRVEAVKPPLPLKAK